MSYLPFDDKHRSVWTSSLGLSALVHVGFGFLLLSSSVPFLPELAYTPEAGEEFALVSIDVLKPVQVFEPEAISELDEVFDETSILAPDSTDSLQPEDAGTDLQADVIEQTVPEIMEPELAEVAPALEPEVSDEGSAPETIDDIAALKEALPESAELLTVASLEPDSIEPEAIVADTVEDLLAAKPQIQVDLEDVAPQEIALTVPAAEPETVEADSLEVVPQDLKPEEPAQVIPTAPQEFLVAEDNFTISEENPLAAISTSGGFGETLGPSDIFQEDVVTLAPDTISLEPEVVHTPEPVAPEVSAEVDNSLSEPEVVEPLAIEAETPTPDVAVEAEPETDRAGEQLALLEPEASPPSHIQDTDPPSEALAPPADQTAVVQPEVKRPAVIANPTPQMKGLGQLIHQIRAVPQPQCSLLLPRRSGTADLGLSLVGADDVALNAVADQVTSRVDADVVRKLDIIDSRQCAALDALRQSTSYPASRIGLALEQTTLQSGDSLKARVLGAGGLNVALLLVDDNGVVQDLTRFASLDGDVVVIDAPVARSGGARTTLQMLVVLGGRAGDFALADQMGKLAQDVFLSLPADVLQAAVFGMATFQVE